MHFTVTDFSKVWPKPFSWLFRQRRGRCDQTPSGECPIFFNSVAGKIPAKERFAKGFSIASLAIAAILCLPQGVLPAENEAGLDRAMQRFVKAVKMKNAAGVLAAFSKVNAWRSVGYSAANPKLIQSSRAHTYAQMAHNFRVRGNMYQWFFEVENDSEVSLSFKFKRGGWRKEGTTFQSTGPFGVSIKWRQEGTGWVVAEIGELIS